MLECKRVARKTSSDSEENELSTNGSIAEAPRDLCKNVPKEVLRLRARGRDPDLESYLPRALTFKLFPFGDGCSESEHFGVNGFRKGDVNESDFKYESELGGRCETVSSCSGDRDSDDRLDNESERGRDKTSMCSCDCESALDRDNELERSLASETERGSAFESLHSFLVFLFSGPRSLSVVSPEIIFGTSESPEKVLFPGPGPGPRHWNPRLLDTRLRMARVADAMPKGLLWITDGDEGEEVYILFVLCTAV